MIRVSSTRTSRHDVLPPYFLAAMPGVGMLPRVPQKRTNVVIANLEHTKMVSWCAAGGGRGAAPLVKNEHAGAELDVVAVVQQRGVHLHTIQVDPVPALEVDDGVLI